MLPPKSDEEICIRAKELGYIRSKTIKLYGEEYEIVSDPFMKGESVALEVRKRESEGTQTLLLPSTILKRAS